MPRTPVKKTNINKKADLPTVATLENKLKVCLCSTEMSCSFQHRLNGHKETSHMYSKQPGERVRLLAHCSGSVWWSRDISTLSSLRESIGF